MKKIALSICLGLGDNIVARIIFDSVKNQYDEIRISHNQDVIKAYKRGDAKYAIFLQEIGNLLFTEKPYYFDKVKYQPIHTLNTTRDLYIPCKPNLQHLLCAGNPLNLGEEYIVMTTKIRAISKKKFLPISIGLWKVLNKLSKRYKIVILGEREVEKNTEYVHFPDLAYGIYEQIITNLPTNRIVDLTVPALGITAPNLSKIKQDGLIMQQAKFVITLGLGGNIWLAATTANKIIGFRDEADRDDAADLLLSPHIKEIMVYKNWSHFINKLEEAP